MGFEARRRHVRYAAGDGFHELAWLHWGSESLPRRALCVHGLTRLGRDFDTLARRLVLHGFQVACPDLPGRGASDRLADPMLYTATTYVAALTHLLAALDWREVFWIGTSLGGTLGMLAAAMPGTPVARLVLNDIGAEVPQQSLARIREYLDTDHRFPDMRALEAYLRHVHAPFGPLSDAEWQALAQHSAVRRPDGELALHYDPEIARAYAVLSQAPIAMWDVWTRVQAPVLILRGESSDVLPAEVAARMASRPGVELETVPGCGHAPALLDHAQVCRVAAFLDG
jgi:pimeloyl-ACP methyl ester carboxylesterase